MKKLLSTALSIAMAVVLLSGCGGNAEEAMASDVEIEEVVSDDFYIYSWDMELQERLSYVFAKYPEIEERIVYVNVGDSDAYREKIETLLVAPDLEYYPDLIVTEADYIMQYTNSDYILPVTDLGLTEADLTEMYPYTIQVATDQRNGSLKGVSWQVCPGAFMYRRSLAEQYLGTSDPAEVQNYVKDWDTFLETAKLINEKSGGATKMISSSDDVKNVFGTNKSSPWIDNDMNFDNDQKPDKMMDVYHELEQKDLTAKTSYRSEEWNAGFSTDGVFSYFGTPNFLHWTTKANCGGCVAGEGTFGDWAVCAGPESYYSGGTWLCATKDCSDTALAGQIMKALCCDTELMTQMAEGTLDFVNSKTAMQTLCDAGKGVYDFLGGQDYIATFSPIAESIDVSGD